MCKEYCRKIIFLYGKSLFLTGNNDPRQKSNCGNNNTVGRITITTAIHLEISDIYCQISEFVNIFLTN